MLETDLTNPHKNAPGKTSMKISSQKKNYKDIDIRIRPLSENARTPLIPETIVHLATAAEALPPPCTSLHFCAMALIVRNI